MMADHSEIEDGKRDYDALMREREQLGNALDERTQERDEAIESFESMKRTAIDQSRSHEHYLDENTKLRAALDAAEKLLADVVAMVREE